PLLDVALRFQIHAVNIGNLNKNRLDHAIKEKIPEYIRGSISGKPTQELSNDLISRTYEYCGDRIKIIGTGGIFCADDAYEKIKRGATLVELITGMIYEGPQLIGSINYDLVRLLKRDGYVTISDAIGAYHRA
ncbi:MAG TPA: quinone-dependent dihydroorotate dehydrogenase, partial [Candidatus Magasanikbacteria bacterium]|nr:quinone-dependent dihydroorotate dehydrogenase [Candidatus Magasanikbacteria bacterium]